MIFSPLTILAIILGGIAGCIATAATFQFITGKPASLVAGNWRKHLWSVIFAIPMPFLLSMGANRWLHLVLTLVVLMLLPSIASKLHFGPKDASWPLLLKLHGAYAIVAVIVFMVVTHIPLMIG